MSVICIVYKVGCWFVDDDDLTGTLHVLQLQLSPLTTSIIRSSNKVQNGDVLSCTEELHNKSTTTLTSDQLTLPMPE